jgi:hypothetical protein
MKIHVPATAFIASRLDKHISYCEEQEKWVAPYVINFIRTVKDARMFIGNSLNTPDPIIVLDTEEDKILISSLREILNS